MTRDSPRTKNRKKTTLKMLVSKGFLTTLEDFTLWQRFYLLSRLMFILNKLENARADFT